MVQPVGRLRHKGSASGVRRGRGTEHRRVVRPGPAVDTLQGPESVEMEVQAIPHRQNPEVGQVTEVGAMRRLVMAKAGSLLTRLEDHEVMERTQVLIGEMEMDAGHRAGLSIVSLEMVQTLATMTQILPMTRNHQMTKVHQTTQVRQ